MGLLSKALRSIGGMTKADIEKAARQASFARTEEILAGSRRPEARGMTPTRMGVPSAEKFSLDDPKFGGGPMVGGTPEALARAARADEMFPVTAYRALREPTEQFPNLHLTEGGRPEFWAATPRTANTYIADKPGMDGFEGSQMMKGRLDPGRSLEIDVGGRGQWDVRASDISDPAVRKALEKARGGVGPMGIARMARDAGYDSVTFKNMVDAGAFGYDGAPIPPDTIYAMLNKSKRRASTAAFDPAKKDSSDLLAMLALASLAGGGGLLSRAQRERQYAPY